MREDRLDIVWMVFLCVSGAETVKWFISLNGIVITDIICIDRTFEKTECVPNESAMNIDGEAMQESIPDAQETKGSLYDVWTKLCALYVREKHRTDDHLWRRGARAICGRPACVFSAIQKCYDEAKITDGKCMMFALAAHPCFKTLFDYWQSRKVRSTLRRDIK